MKIIFGLGNPGKEYERTRHNAGFMTVNALCEKFSVRLKKKDSLQAALGEACIGGNTVILAEPLTYMNDSGWAVSAVTDYYKCRPADIIVVYDDIDILFGELRIRDNGSAGTHNGMRSVVNYLGTDDFVRVRIGIGPPKFELISFVLGKFDKEEKEQLKSVIERAAMACECILTDSVHKAQTLYQKAE